MRFAAFLLLISLSDAGTWGDSVAAAMDAERALKENAPSAEAISEKASKGAAALSDAGAAAAQEDINVDSVQIHTALTNGHIPQSEV